MESKSREEIEAEKAAAEYMKEYHPELTEGRTVYSGLVEDQNKAVEEQKKAEENAPMSEKEKLAIGVGAGAGAYATHKDLVRNLTGSLASGAPSTYAPVNKPTVTISSPTMVEPHLGPHSILPNEITNLETYDSDVEKMMQSIKDKNKPTGAQNERGHNWETSRESLATKSNLKTMPNADKAIVEAGRMTPMRSTNIGIPEHVARQLEEENLRKEAQRRVAEETAKREAEAKATAQKQAQAEAKALEEAQAAKSARNAGLRRGVARVGVGALGGALGAKDIYDVYEKYKHNEPLTEEDYLKIAGGAGGILSTIPTPLTEGAGLAIAGGALAYPYIKRALTK
jgi:hypothetical protein